MDMIPDKVLEAVKDAAPEGRLSCADAHALAKRLDVELLIIGKAADELKIKIKSCQLGCF
ncbi:hypothetical protein [Phosphitispora sp. TUW77]|uniref:hypothetical protein n=1 Tax=Phosphitispora sp. TUW77 TaxID=3152361 RepID=UPI003AB438C0